MHDPMWHAHGVLNQWICQITSLDHLETAIVYALLAVGEGALRTKTVHSEILWALNPSSNVRPLALNLQIEV
jgi:hypothetical protein